jgi:hypothetical protein
MTRRPPVPISAEQIAAFCRKWGVSSLALFGSVLRADFRHDESDVDVLVTFVPESRPSLFDMITMRRELEAIFGRSVDLVERRLIEQSDNWIRRKHILESAEIIYGS